MSPGMQVHVPRLARMAQAQHPLRAVAQFQRAETFGLQEIRIRFMFLHAARFEKIPNFFEKLLRRKRTMIKIHQRVADLRQSFFQALRRIAGAREGGDGGSVVLEEIQLKGKHEAKIVVFEIAVRLREGPRAGTRICTHSHSPYICTYMKTLYSYYSRHWLMTTFALILSAVSIVFSMLDPHLYNLLIDEYLTKIPGHTSDTFFRGVTLLLLGVVGVAMISRIAKNIQDYMVNVIVQKVGAAIYKDGIRHTMELPYQDFEDKRSGETLGILQKVRSDTERFTQSFIGVVFSTLVSVIFVTIYSWSIYWLIAPIFLVTLPIISIISLVLSKRIKEIQKTIVKETTALAGSTTESLRNIELIKGLGLSEQEIGRLNGITGRILELELQKVKRVRTLAFIQGTCINLIRTTVVFVMIWLMWQGRIQLGDFVALLFFSFYIFGPLQEIGSFINIYRETQISFDNFDKLLRAPKEPRPETPVRAGDVETIAFSSVRFMHRSGMRPALDNVSFHVGKGETIAFVGPSGSGKTTLIKLLTGLYRPGEGDISYNGISYAKIPSEELRRQIGLVSQDTQLFSGTLRENLRFVKPDANEEEMMRALQQAACASILARSDKGLDTVIGEGGVKLSGGEKQRIAIARALLRDPNILVFDEATSALDSLTEEEISETIREVSASSRQITVLIAHRLSTVMHADRIYVMEKGRIIETGTHAQLLRAGSLYAAMWRQQAGEARHELGAAVK